MRAQQLTIFLRQVLPVVWLRQPIWTWMEVRQWYIFWSGSVTLATIVSPFASSIVFSFLCSLRHLFFHPPSFLAPPSTIPLICLCHDAHSARLRPSLYCLCWWGRTVSVPRISQSREGGRSDKTSEDYQECSGRLLREQSDQFAVETGGC